VTDLDTHQLARLALEAAPHLSVLLKAAAALRDREVTEQLAYAASAPEKMKAKVYQLVYAALEEQYGLEADFWAALAAEQHNARPQSPATMRKVSARAASAFRNRTRTDKPEAKQQEKTPEAIARFVCDLRACRPLIRSSTIPRAELAQVLEELGVNITLSTLYRVSADTSIKNAQHGRLVMSQERLTTLRAALEQLTTKDAPTNAPGPAAAPEPVQTPQEPVGQHTERLEAAFPDHKKKTPAQIAQIVSDLKACQPLIQSSTVPRAELAQVLGELGVKVNGSFLGGVAGGSVIRLAQRGKMLIGQNRLTDLRAALERLSAENAQTQQPLLAIGSQPITTETVRQPPRSKKKTPEETLRFVADLEACQALIKTLSVPRTELALQLQKLGVSVIPSALSGIAGGSSIQLAKRGQAMFTQRRLTDLRTALEQLASANTPSPLPEPGLPPQPPAETRPAPHHPKTHNA